MNGGFGRSISRAFESQSNYAVRTMVQFKVRLFSGLLSTIKQWRVAASLFRLSEVKSARKTVVTHLI